MTPKPWASSALFGQHAPTTPAPHSSHETVVGRRGLPRKCRDLEATNSNRRRAHSLLVGQRPPQSTLEISAGLQIHQCTQNPADWPVRPTARERRSAPSTHAAACREDLELWCPEIQTRHGPAPSPQFSPAHSVAGACGSPDLYCGPVRAVPLKSARRLLWSSCASACQNSENRSKLFAPSYNRCTWPLKINLGTCGSLTVSQTSVRNCRTMPIVWM
jgi:hypothetical protein